MVTRTKVYIHIAIVLVLFFGGLVTGYFVSSFGTSELIGQLRSNVAQLTESNRIAIEQRNLAESANSDLRTKLDASISDLARANEINRRLAETNSRLENRVSELEATNSRLAENNRELNEALDRGKTALGRIKEIVGDIEGGTGEAKDLIGRIIEAFRRIREEIIGYNSGT